MPEITRVIQTSGLATGTALQTVDDFVDDLETRLSAVRAGYLDNLSAGAVALQSAVDDLEGRLTAARATALDELASGGFLRDGTEGVNLLYPSGASGTNLSNSSAWGFGSWTEFVAASVLTSHSLIAIFVGLANEGEIQIGTGGAGSESAIALIPCTHQGYIWLSQPIIIPANARVAARIRYANASTSGGYKLLFMPRPF